MKLQSIAVILIISYMHIDNISCGDILVKYFEHANFKGASEAINMVDDTCWSLESFDNRISSINTAGVCVRIYADKGCKNDFRTMEPGSPGHFNLEDINFDDLTSSMKRC